MKLINFLDTVGNPYLEQQVRVVDYSILPNDSFIELVITFFISSIILFAILGIVLIILDGIKYDKNSNKYLQIFKSFKIFIKMIIISFIIITISFLFMY